MGDKASGRKQWKGHVVKEGHGRRKTKHLVRSKKKGEEEERMTTRLEDSIALPEHCWAEPKHRSVGKKTYRSCNGSLSFEKWGKEGPENLMDLTEVHPVERKTKLEMQVSWLPQPRLSPHHKGRHSLKFLVTQRILHKALHTFYKMKALLVLGSTLTVGL